MNFGPKTDNSHPSNMKLTSSAAADILGSSNEAIIVVVDDETRTLKHVIKGQEIITPTGKFNVYNTLNDVY